MINFRFERLQKRRIRGCPHRSSSSSLITSASSSHRINMLKIIIITVLIAFAAADDGLDVAACVRIIRGICNGGLFDAAACTAACGGIPHVGVCLNIPPLDLGAEVCVCIS